jgi:hypothetical protein
MGHYVRDNYSVLSNMTPTYHIVTVRVFEHSGHTYGGFISVFLEQGMTSGIRAVLTI